MSDIFGFGIKLITMMGSICKVGVSTLLQIAGALSVFQQNGGGEEERLGATRRPLPLDRKSSARKLIHCAQQLGLRCRATVHALNWEIC